MLLVMAFVALAGMKHGGTDETASLAANLDSTIKAMQAAGRPLPPALIDKFREALTRKDAGGMINAVAPAVFLEVTINAEGRVRVSPGATVPSLKARRSTLALVKVNNQSGGQQRLLTRCSCPGADANPFSVAITNPVGGPADLRGLDAEYLLLKVSCDRPGPREAVIAFHAGQGTEDLGFRGETAVLFKVAD